MAEQPAPTVEPLSDATASAIIALCDRYLAMAGLPTYGALADAKIADIEQAASRLVGEDQRRMAAEMLRLRVAHGVVASELRAALVALERQDLFAADNLMTQAVGTASLHARPHHAGQTLPANVVSFSAARQNRRARDFGGL